MDSPLRRHFVVARDFPHFRQVQIQRTWDGAAVGAQRQAERPQDWVIGGWQAAFVVAIKLDFHFGTVGEAVAVVFVHFIQDACVPAVAPFIAFQVRDLGIGRDL
ncbi:hypothetical protein D3C79_855190 [compost metagenome]